MRLVVIGSGSPMSTEALAALASSHTVVAAVLPDSKDRRLAIATRRFRRLCVRFRIPMLRYDPRRTAADLESLRADLICVATFQHILKPELLGAARLGGINLHPSLLPRHRGPNPLFWSYRDGDREAGMTVHWMTERVDAGDVIAGVAIPVPQGIPSRKLYGQMALAGGKLLAECVDGIERGNASRAPQDEQAATTDPQPQIPDFSDWSVERLWHYLGLSDLSNDLLPIRHGRRLAMGRGTDDGLAGQVQIRNGCVYAICADGWVKLARDSRLERWLRLIRWLKG